MARSRSRRFADLIGKDAIVDSSNDLVGGGGGAVTTYSSINALPLSGNDAGDQAFVSENNRLYIWTGDGWYNIALVNTDPSIQANSYSSSYDLSTEGTATTVTLIASDPEGVPITWTYANSGLGSIATISQSNNVFTITPTSNAELGGTFSVTFKASDGVNLAAATSEFTLNFVTINSKYTTALITSVGSNGATNSTLTDSSTINHTVTVNGDASSQSFSPYRAGGYSYYFDGTGDYISIPDGDWKTFGTEDFTIEMWFNSTSTTKRQYLFSDIASSGQNDTSSVLLYLDAGALKVYIQDTTYHLIQGSTSYSANVWHHVAVARNGSTVTLYLDGQSEGTYSIGTASVNDSSIDVKIGRADFSTAYDFTGYISDVRVVKGTAVYTSAFTPPTERLTAVTNTSLLTCHLPYLADGSSNNHAITVNGNVSAKPVGPYDYKEYDSATHGGSVYFDGTSDYATVPADTTNLTLDGDFTIDFWVYPTSALSAEYVYGKWNNNSDGWAVFVTTDYSSGNFGSLTLYYGTYGLNEAATSLRTEKLKQYQWNHCRITKESGVIYLAINGVVGTRSNYGANGLNWEDTRSFNANATLGIGGHTNYKYGPGYIADLRVIKGTALTTTNFTPPTEPSTAITNTKLLISGTDASIVDKSQSTQLTLVGDTQSSTTVTNNGSSSMYFDGNGDYIDTDISAIGTDDFTIECWVYVTSNSANQLIFDSRPTSTDNTTGFNIQYQTGNNFYVGSFGTGYITGSTTRSLNTWYHVAVTRSNNTMTLWVNGQSDGTYSHSVNLTSTDVRIGTNRSAVSVFNGYIEDFRITKGLARYTENFTPPTASLEG